MSNKVYCKECKFLEVTYSNIGFICNNPDAFWYEYIDNWYSSNVHQIRDGNPVDINKDNNCSWFEE
jgi:hypothetical protein